MTVGADTAVANLGQLAEFLGRVCQAEELDERFELAAPSDPERRVVEALNAFLDKLWISSFQLTAKQELLEKVIEIRTNEVHEILDNVNTGFLIALQDERVLDNFSRSCTAIFGREDLQGHKISELLGGGERRQEHFSACYEQVFEGFLPVELALDQLPKEFTLGDRTFSIQGTPIAGKDGRTAKLFFTINDTTELRKLEAENALRQALIEIVRQRDGFRAFLQDTARAFQAVREAPSEARLRNVLHTTKGNLGCFGLHEIASVIHTIEDSSELNVGHLQHVESLLKRFLEAHRAIVGMAYPEAGNARDGDLDRLRPLLASLVAEPSQAARQAALDELLRKLSWVPAASLLTSVRPLVDRVALRLDKLVVLTISGEDMLVEPRQMSAVFANLGHLVRNALDHGFELPAERHTKPLLGQLDVRCHETAAAWHVEVSDDGRGIDAEAVGAAAVARGKLTADQLAAMPYGAKLRLIFADGVTTRTEATLESGRGVGMAALLDAVEAAGGTIDVTTKVGEGTAFAIQIPKRS